MLEAIIPESAEAPQEVMLRREQACGLILEASNSLTDRQFEFVMRLYVSGCSLREADIARAMGVCRERARDLRESAFKRMRAAFAERGIYSASEVV